MMNMLRVRIPMCLGGLILLVLAFSGCALFNFGGTKLVDEGKPCADIVISEKPPRMVKLAAEELQTYIEKISGAKLAITNAPGDDVPTHIYVGRSTYTDKLNITDEGLKYDAFKIVSGNNWLALVGHDSDFTPKQPYSAGHSDWTRMLKEWDSLTGENWSNPYYNVFKQYSKKMDIWDFDERGSLNAVYAFLRDQGVRWYMPGDLGEIVPKTATIMLSHVDKTVHPDFAIRYPFQYYKDFVRDDKVEILWHLRMGFNRAPDVLGDSCEIGIFHGIERVISREETQKAHPEYYTLLGGKRTNSGKIEPCLSSPGLFESNVKYARAVFDIYDAPMVSVMPTDGYYRFCECELCKGKDTPERYRGGLSDYVWGYVNRVAQEVYKTHPDKMISCCAYTTYSMPPTNIATLSPNVMVILAQIRREQLSSQCKLNPEQYKWMKELSQEWLKKIPKGRPLIVYDYYLYASPRHETQFMPVYFPHTIAEDIRSFKGISMGEYIEVYRELDIPAFKGVNSIGITHLNLYVTAQCWWDADQDVDRLLNEYYTLFYGSARDEMKAFVDYSEANWMYLGKDADKIGQVVALLDKAQGKVAPDSVYAKRIKLIADYIRPLKDLQKQLALGRGPVPVARGLNRDAKDLKLDGKLDDAFWQGLESYTLKELETGRPAFRPTSFKVAWAGDSLYVGIECKGASKAALTNTPTRHDDPGIFEGEDVEIMLETPNHSYYQLAISPASGLFDNDCKGEKEPKWSSNAQVSTRIDGDTWSVEIRIPVADPSQETLLPLIGVAGNKPSETYPWYFNIYRQGVSEKGRELSAFSPTGTDGFHVPKKFGKFYVQ